MDTWVLYYLSDERSLSDIRYVGITKSPKKRFYAHSADKRVTHKACWVRSVRRDGAKIVLTIAIDGMTWDEAKQKEIDTIAALRRSGARLTNGTDGGEGVVGHIPSDELRALRAANATGRTHSSDTRAKMSAWQMGIPKSKTTREKIAAAHRLNPPVHGGLKGVYTRGNRWIANIYLGGKQKFLGTFETPEKAGRAFDAAAIKAWGSDVWLNFPEDRAVAS